MFKILFLFLFSLYTAQTYCASDVYLGVDLLFHSEYATKLKGKKIGLITNQSGMNRDMKGTVELLKAYAPTLGFKLVALFAPEHGLQGDYRAGEEIDPFHDSDHIPVHSLYGSTMRPTPEMLKDIDLLIFDIQDIGSRSYTFLTTLCMMMEEAAKRKIKLLVLDRPNPINGLTIDGPMLEDKFRSPVSYINVPYCHGMTVGELARFYNGEYKIGCSLEIIPMRGWKRWMSFQDTGLPWIPTSPYIAESDTPFYYSTTGIIGELKLVNIGIGYTLPFKLVGAPWIDADKLAKTLNDQNFPGVHFKPYYYTPFYGRYAHKHCQGVLIFITNPKTYQPIATQYLLIGIIKNLYPQQFKQALKNNEFDKDMFDKLNGTHEVYKIMTDKKDIVWKLRSIHQKERAEFQKIRLKYILPEYS